MAKITADQISEEGYIIHSPKSKPVFMDNMKDTKSLIAILKGMTQKTVDDCLNIIAEDPFIKLKEQEVANE